MLLLLLLLSLSLSPSPFVNVLYYDGNASLKSSVTEMSSLYQSDRCRDKPFVFFSTAHYLDGNNDTPVNKVKPL